MKGRVNTGGGGSGGILTVTAPEGSTIEVSKGTRKYTKSGGVAVFKGLETGTWTVTIRKGGQTATQQIEIDANYELTMNYFSATIAVTFPTDCTSVTCTKDSTVLSVPSGSLSSGSYTFDIPEAGEWVLYATNGTKEKTVTVTVSEETEYTARLAFGEVLVNGNDTGISGGWAKTLFDNSGEGNPKATVTINEQGITCDATSGMGHNLLAIFAANNQIDFTGYNTLVANVTTLEQSPIAGKAEIVLSKMNNADNQSAGRIVLATGEKQLDVSQVSGEYYVLITFNTTATQGQYRAYTQRLVAQSIVLE